PPPAHIPASIEIVGLLLPGLGRRPSQQRPEPSFPSPEPEQKNPQLRDLGFPATGNSRAIDRGLGFGDREGPGSLRIVGDGGRKRRDGNRRGCEIQNPVLPIEQFHEHLVNFRFLSFHGHNTKAFDEKAQQFVANEKEEVEDGDPIPILLCR
ncbi:eukaryotic translation initiation factor 3subunit K, partial [Striga asiatica]